MCALNLAHWPVISENGCGTRGCHLSVPCPRCFPPYHRSMYHVQIYDYINIHAYMYTHTYVCHMQISEYLDGRSGCCTNANLLIGIHNILQRPDERRRLLDTDHEIYQVRRVPGAGKRAVGGNERERECICLRGWRLMEGAWCTSTPLTHRGGKRGEVCLGRK